MTGTTISGGHVSGITLSNASYNPATIAAGGVINTTVGSALYGLSGTTWTVTNEGSLNAANGGGIKLAAGGDITNAAGGSITGSYGIDFGKNNTAGTVLNAGYISASSVGVNSYYDLVLNNTTSGHISGFYGVWVGGAFAAGGAGMVTNTGEISGANFGVYLEHGGTVANQMGGQITATGSAYSEGGVKANGPMTVINNGTISGTRDVGFPTTQRYHHAYGVAFLNGGVVTNQVNGLIIGQSTNIYTSGAGILSGGNGIATVVNAGTIEGSFRGTGDGLSLIGGGIVTNLSTGLIASYNQGQGHAVFTSGIGVVSTVVNAGTITGGVYGPAVNMTALGNVTNQAGGVLIGTYGILENYGDGLRSTTIVGTVINAGEISSHGNGVVASNRPLAIINQAGGTIEARNAGVELVAGGTFINQAGAELTGGFMGVSVYLAAGTIINAGAIISTTTVSGTGHYGAVALSPGYANRVVVDPGATFAGRVDGGNAIGSTPVSTIELAAGAGLGTITGFGTQFIDFGAVAIDPGASWLVGGDTVGLGGIISGFVPGDTIDLTGFVATGKTFASNVLTLSDSSTIETLNLPGSYHTAQFTIEPDGTGGTFITVACFAEGTRILTARGEVPVEALREGDLVQTLRRLVPVRWTGFRHLDLRRHARPSDVQPVRISADAFGPGMPHADLLVSPDHAIFVDGVLIPARHLVNGVTIVQHSVDEITYFHVELPDHEVLLANGLAAESYLDTGNRGDFANGGPVVGVAPEPEYRAA